MMLVFSKPELYTFAKKKAQPKLTARLSYVQKMKWTFVLLMWHQNLIEATLFVHTESGMQFN